MNFSSNKVLKLLRGVAILLLLSSSVSVTAQTKSQPKPQAKPKVFAGTTSNDQYANSGSNEKYVFYVVSAGKTDGGFNNMAIIREDKKTKERVVLYSGRTFFGLDVCDEWVYFRPFASGGYLYRITDDGSKLEKIYVGQKPIIYKGRLYFSDNNELKFYNLKTMDIVTASTEIEYMDVICDDVAVIFNYKKNSYTMAKIDPTSGLVSDVKTFNLNGLDNYYGGYLMVNDGYFYYSGGNTINKGEGR